MKNSKPKISVIIPTYGDPFYLSKSISSVLGQSFKDLELIIVDDNNPDTKERNETENVVIPFLNKDSRIKYLKHERNKNGAVARNTGFAIAQGEYISLLDSDDEYNTNRLLKCYEVMQTAPDNVAGVYTGCEFRRHGKKYHVEKSVPSGNFLVQTLACRFMFCTGSNIFVRKSVVDELGGFDPTFLRHQDYEFLVRLFEKYSLIGLPEVLVVKNNELLNFPDVQKLIDIKEKYLNKFKYVIDTLSRDDKRFIYFWKNIVVAEAAMAQNNTQLANKYYNEAKQYGRLTFKLWFRRIVYPIYNHIK